MMTSATRIFFTRCWFTILMFLDLLCLFVPRQNPVSSDEKVLIVRLDSIGDFVLWTASLQQLLAPYLANDCPVSLLGNVSWTSVADGLGCFREILPLDRAKFITNSIYRFRLLLKIRRARYTTVIVPVYSREALFGDSVIRLSGAQTRIGSMGDFTNIGPWFKKVTDSWYTKLIPADPLIKTELQRNAEFVSLLWGRDVPLALPSLPVQAFVPEELRDREYFVVAPGAQVIGKQWPLPNFREVISSVYKSSTLVGVVCGSPSEERLGTALSKDYGKKIFNYVGRTSLIELIALIAGAKLVLSNDTAAVHIAAAVSTPAVCVVGGYHFGRFLPYPQLAGMESPVPIALYHAMPCFHCNWRCPYRVSSEEPFPCVSFVKPEEMLTEIKLILNHSIKSFNQCRL